ncbi:lacI family transcriptional regulator [Burkholderiales bacterium GJ-E10]|nr:lacI family transcriptional regulator [Burkholderiales bacterium GJ-E10]
MHTPKSPKPPSTREIARQITDGDLRAWRALRASALSDPATMDKLRTVCVAAVRSTTPGHNESSATGFTCFLAALDVGGSDDALAEAHFDARQPSCG